ncbi:Dephospho-CoA kinase [Candidatus Izimaplasma bacterium HR1]|uniref:dephospho-CoA kinase n=1 Tax=Candidatus Izimoplasma sp. HR1 TaxID=1541959 RepID=UPI0004F70636|nr:Dephospho-CoA kinase [Candidatus Izimaplasma bacterium HR1]
MKILGLTGGIASGKSTVTKFFIDEGIPVIDTDLIARNLLNKGTESYNEVIEFFSDEILLTNNEINRKKLGRIIFSNPQKRHKLNEICHPKVLKEVNEQIALLKEENAKVIVIDVPLLFETNYQELVDKTIVVYTSPEKQLERLISRDSITEEYAKMKINSQTPLSEKVTLADYVIDNSFSILDTKRDFKKILKDLEV